MGKALEFDKSLFERLYRNTGDYPGFERTMLEVDWLYSTFDAILIHSLRNRFSTGSPPMSRAFHRKSFTKAVFKPGHPARQRSMQPLESRPFHGRAEITAASRPSSSFRAHLRRTTEDRQRATPAKWHSPSTSCPSFERLLPLQSRLEARPLWTPDPMLMTLAPCYMR